MSEETSEAEQLTLDVAAAEKPKRRTRKKAAAEEGAAPAVEAAPAEEETSSSRPQAQGRGRRGPYRCSRRRGEARSQEAGCQEGREGH